MGGNLFNLGRLPRDAYLDIEADVSAFLDDLLGPEHHRIPRYYDSKPDFGDLDILLCSDGFPHDWASTRDAIVRGLGVTRTQQTGAVFSTVYRDFQVDYFVRPAETFESTWAFLCYNDLGNLLGKIFRRFNLKYGERGLEYVFRRQDQNYKADLFVCRDMPRILDFIGLDFATWDAGFADLEAMYRWVLSSPFFSVEPYLDPSSRAMRKRQKLRTTIRRFVDFLEREDIHRAPDLGSRYDHLPRILAAFPDAHLAEAIAAEEAREAEVLALRERFNGRRVMRLIPGLEGPALGAFIRHVKASFDDFEAEVLALTPEAVDARVLELFEAYEPV